MENEKELQKSIMTKWVEKENASKEIEKELKGDLGAQLVSGFNNCKALVEVLYGIWISRLDVTKKSGIKRLSHSLIQKIKVRK